MFEYMHNNIYVIKIKLFLTPITYIETITYMIELSNSEIGLCLNFSYAVTARTEKYYKVRNKYASTEKLIFDHFSGKLAELAVLKHLDKKGYLVSYPCFKLSNSGDSGADLTTFSRELNKISNVHVKCCRFDSPVKDSWLIQRSEINKLGDNDYFALCVFHSPSQIEVKKIIAANNIEWKAPVLSSLKSKAACYLKDMI
jgi:hypothetical protein